jgi:hypothetical protein
MRNFDPVVNVFSPAGVPPPLELGRPNKPPGIDNEAGLILPPLADARMPPPVPSEDLVGGSVSESPIPKEDWVSPKRSLPPIRKASGTYDNTLLINNQVGSKEPTVWLDRRWTGAWPSC